LSPYDVVFVGDVGVAEGELTREQATMLKALVEYQGSGLVFLPGYRQRLDTFLGTPLEELLPVTLDPAVTAVKAHEVESHFMLTQAGSDHLLTMLAHSPAANSGTWRGLAGFHRYTPVVKAATGSRVLAVHSTHRNAHGRLPLLVTRDHGNGKVLFMGTDEAWRWRKGVEDTYHYRFWGQVVRWMAHKRHLASQAGTRLFYTPESPMKHNQVFLHATLQGADGMAGVDPTVEATVTSPAGNLRRLAMVPNGAGWGVFMGSFTPEEAGRHTVVVVSRRSGETVSATLDVRAEVLEKVGLPARRQVMDELAAITGGRSGGVAQLGELMAAVEAMPRREAKPVRFRLWCHPGWIALNIAGLCLLWTVRKLWGYA